MAQVPNIHRLLKKHDVDVDVMTAGEFKRTVTIFGENTEKGKQKFQQELEETHDLFKQFVAQNRPHLDVEKIATGEHWFGVTISGTLGLTALLSRDGQSSPQRVAMLASFLNVFGFGLGPLIGGVLGQWGAQPLLTAYIPTLILGLVLF